MLQLSLPKICFNILYYTIFLCPRPTLFLSLMPSMYCNVPALKSDMYSIVPATVAKPTLPLVWLHLPANRQTGFVLRLWVHIHHLHTQVTAQILAGPLRAIAGISKPPIQEYFLLDFKQSAKCFAGAIKNILAFCQASLAPTL